MWFWHTLDTPQKRVKVGHSQAGAPKACAGSFDSLDRNAWTHRALLLRALPGSYRKNVPPSATVDMLAEASASQTESEKWSAVYGICGFRFPLCGQGLVVPPMNPARHPSIRC